MYNFRKISAYSDEYRSMREANEEFLASFTSFSKEITARRKSSKHGETGSATAYTRQLIKLGVIIKEYLDEEILFNSSKFYKELNNLRRDDNYNYYNNEQEGRFPNAAIERYYEYQAYIALNNDDLNDILSGVNNEIGYLNDYKIEKNEDNNKIQKMSVTTEQIVRTQLERNKSLNRAMNKCENNIEHYTFISRSTGKQYVEGHHLIPLSYQKLFEKPLDVAENIIILCPNCHRKFHHGTQNEQKKLIKKFYNKRKVDLFSKIGKISLEELYNYYGV